MKESILTVEMDQGSIYHNSPFTITHRASSETFVVDAGKWRRGASRWMEQLRVATLLLNKPKSVAAYAAAN